MKPAARDDGNDSRRNLPNLAAPLPRWYAVHLRTGMVLCNYCLQYIKI